MVTGILRLTMEIIAQSFQISKVLQMPTIETVLVSRHFHIYMVFMIPIQ